MQSLATFWPGERRWGWRTSFLVCFKVRLHSFQVSLNPSDPVLIHLWMESVISWDGPTQLFWSKEEWGSVWRLNRTRKSQKGIESLSFISAGRSISLRHILRQRSSGLCLGVLVGWLIWFFEAVLLVDHACGSIAPLPRPPTRILSQKDFSRASGMAPQGKVLSLETWKPEFNPQSSVVESLGLWSTLPAPPYPKLN